MNEFNSLGEAWLFGLQSVMKNGDIVIDENVRQRDISLSNDRLELDKYKTDDSHFSLKLKEIRGYNIRILNISEDDAIIKKYGNKERIEYTIKRYGSQCGENGYGKFLRGDNNEIVLSIIDKLSRNNDSKSAVIISPNEWGGNFGKSPCLTMVDFLIRNNELLMYVVYRSQNIYTKHVGNLIALNQLHEEVAKALGVSKGFLELYVCSAHIYECDFQNVMDILKNERMIYNE